MKPKRGEIYLVNFDPTLGAEIKKTRPALVLQNDILNKSLPTTIVAAITSRIHTPLYPPEVFIPKNTTGLKVDSVVLLNQLRTADHKRLYKRLGKLSAEKIQEVDQSLGITLSLIGGNIS